MATVSKIEKVTEGTYLVTSRPCPECADTLTTQLSDTYLYGLQRGESVATIFAHLVPADRERFLSGYCPDCWTKLFAYGEDEE